MPSINRDEISADAIPVERGLSRRVAEEHALVLTAVGISCRIEPEEDGRAILVAEANAFAARRQLAQYVRENADTRPSPPRHRSVSDGIEGAMAYCAIMVGLFVAEHKEAFDLDWVRAGAAQAGLIQSGEVWRSVTALGLHANAGHLIGNLGFGAFAGILLAHLLGSGFGWLAILAAGTLGNLATALFHASSHTSIGASTAVFGAVGLLAGYTQRIRLAPRHRHLRRWAPVAAGFMLLAFLGVGDDKTDVWAHIAGFTCGVVLGLAVAQVPRDVLTRPRFQHRCGALALGIFALAWFASF